MSLVTCSLASTHIHTKVEIVLLTHRTHETTKWLIVKYTDGNRELFFCCDEIPPSFDPVHILTMRYVWLGKKGHIPHITKVHAPLRELNLPKDVKINQILPMPLHFLFYFSAFINYPSMKAYTPIILCFLLLFIFILNSQQWLFVCGCVELNWLFRDCAFGMDVFLCMAFWMESAVCLVLELISASHECM